MKRSYFSLRSISLNISLKYLIIAIYPILSIYFFVPGITYGSLIIILYLISKLIMPGRIKVDTSFIVMMTIFICLNLLQLIINQDANKILIRNNTFSMLLFLIVYSAITSDLEEDIDKAYKYLRFVAVLSSLALFLQIISWTFLHKRILLFIPGIKMIAYPDLSMYYYRPESFFCEPSHFALYLLPVLALSLLKRDYRFSVFFISALILSTSSLGILLSVILIIWHFRKALMDKINVNRVLIILFVSAIFVLFMIIFESTVVTFAYKKLFTIFRINSDSRLLGNLNYTGFFGFTDYLFGIGINQFSHIVHLKLGLHVPNYGNSLVFSFISFGFIGLGVWLIYIFIVLKRLPAEYSSLGIIFLFVCALDQIMFNQNLLYLLTLLSIVITAKRFDSRYLNEISVDPQKYG